MPEENWFAHGGVPACDLCHARKIKCDRKEPCSSCLVAKVECLRNRHKRAPRPKVRTEEKIQALVQRLSTLEHSVRSKQPTPDVIPEPDIANGIITPNEELPSNRPLKRKRTASSLDGSFPASTPAVDGAPQAANEARHHISKELSTNGLLSTHQRSVLETAITFVDHLSHTPAPAMTDRSTFDKSMYVSTDMSQREIFNVILGTESKELGDTAIRLHTLDHVPPKAVERIALALMEGTADEKTLNLYKVIIHFKAAVVLYASQLQGPKSAAVQKHIQQMEYDHLTAALTALDSVSFLTAPSLLLAQALITGAMLMQIMGNPVACSELTAHASRTILALGYHNISNTVPENDLNAEIYAAVAHCAQLDSTMSLLLLRPRTLPSLPIKVSELLQPDPSNPMTVFEIAALEMVPVHHKILDLTLEPSMKRSPARLKAEVTQLRQTMKEIQEMMADERPARLLDTRLDILIHWKGLEFKYFSTLTSVHRLSPTVTTDASEREECLQSARKALECVKSIEDIGKGLGHFIEGFDPYLAWSMLSYPLCPFFVVFCNVVGTSDVRDFQLLQDVTDGISSLVTENKYVNRLHRLCATLLGLCKPLVQAPGLNEPMRASNTGLTAPLATYCPSLASHGGSDILPDNNVNGTTENMVPSSWNDDMMWQLFQSQPSLDWFNADILDPAWDIGQPK
ncbi:putative Zn(II)2Cys6 transcription factor-like protein [Decorospora gaudefroyi]|uniref:Putative Zn(II)2Cys6 transcription factor-like protein n=1 Tax=Decorospora gaudefroyi TaxID=184978 RepID=A0A6A5K6U5_9PLEO|nr:putative Zn(II)2Cys6 transcription factor-like protein [Decorospora gaudefroyi]